ncbi:4163_t:CDS:2, partial [Racocetra persica]
WLNMYSKDGPDFLFFPVFGQKVHDLSLLSLYHTNSPVDDIDVYLFLGYIFLGNNEMIQFTSFAGLGGLNFILSWSGTVGAYVIKSWKASHFGNYLEIIVILFCHQSFLESVSDISSISGSDIDAGSNSDAPILGNGVNVETTENNDNSPQSRNFKKLMVIQLTNPVIIYLIAIFFVIAYGSIRYSTTYIPFYQRNIESYAAHSLVKIGCVIGANNNFENKYYVDRTEELARNGSKFILWSE